MSTKEMGYHIVEMPLNTPVLYIVFNRLDTVRRTFSRIAEQKPSQLYIAADGPRKEREGEAESCAAVRDYVLSRIDWPCSVHTLFRDENLGCKYGVSAAIKWFFSSVESGIVLEDDILPEPSFFSYCEKMLDAWRDNPKVAAVCSFNREGVSHFRDDVFLCTALGVWGWASWADKIKDYSPDYSVLDEDVSSKGLRTCFLSRRADRELLSNAHRAAHGELNTWDYQLSAYMAVRWQYALVPRKSLVQNIGFSSNSTHTGSAPAWYTGESWDWGGEISIPSKLRLNKAYSRLCESEYIPKMTFRRRMNRIHDVLVYAFDRMGILGAVRWILHHTVKRGGK
ncbi:MAG: nucleotide-diphospho-sugar transferase [Treponema sp.]|nr:nucleotide-diphospho-sugar transferase [Treponema sp.]